MNTDEVKSLDSQYLFQNYGRQNLCFERGEAEFLYDLDGKKYIDLVAGIAVNALGYAHPDIVSAICEQSRRLMHVSNLYLVKEQALAAEALASVCPDPICKTLFVNSGAEANEAALKLAVKHTDRSRIVTAKNSFHGRTAASLSATGQPKYQNGFTPLLSHAFDYIEYGNVEELKNAVNSETAAVLMEPIQGEGGVIPAGKEFFKAAREICDDYGALFIVDEVQTGMGRTGKWFGFENYGVVPDIFTLAKALGGGFPIGACVTSPEIAETLKPGMHGTTFGGNPMGCTLVKTVIDVMKRDKLVERSSEAGSKWMADLKKASSSEVRGYGMMLGMVVEDGRGLQAAALENNILVNVCGGGVVRLIPPLITSDESLSAFTRVVEDFF